MAQLEQSVVAQANSLNYTKEEIAKAKERISGLLVEKWDENLIFSRIEGLQMKKLERYVKSLSSLVEDLDEKDIKKIVATIQSAEFSDKSECPILDFSVESGIVYKRGFIAFNKNEESEKINILISVYRFEMNISGPLKIETVPKKKFGLIPWGTEQKVTVQKPEFRGGDINAMKELFCAYKCFQQLPIDGLKSISWLENAI